MKVERTFDPNENVGETYDYLLCPHCFEHTLEEKYEKKRAKNKKEKIIKHSKCISDNDNCPYKDGINREEVASQYGSNPKETHLDKLKKIKWKNVGMTIIYLSIILTLAVLFIQNIQ